MISEGASVSGERTGHTTHEFARTRVQAQLFLSVLAKIHRHLHLNYSTPAVSTNLGGIHHLYP